MNKLLETFIKKGLPLLSVEELENYSAEWIEAKGHMMQDKVLPHIINLKLLKYESEY